MSHPRILFICTYQGGRSRIAAEYMNKLSGGQVEAFSACFDPGSLSPAFVSLLKEVDIDVPPMSPPSVFDLYRKGESFDYVISLCQQGTNELCPVFNTSIDALYSKKAERELWSIRDLKSLGETKEEWLVRARVVREEIKEKSLQFLDRLEITPVQGL